MANFLKILMALTLGLMAFSASAESTDIRIQNPWVRAAPPNVSVLAAYLEIKNDGGKPRILNRVSSPAFDQAGIHQTVMHENMARMEHMMELTIPPHASVELKPGGMHLMLMAAKKPVQLGDQIPITLTFKDGKKITFAATVRASQMEGMEHQQHMDHSGHGSHKP